LTKKTDHIYTEKGGYMKKYSQLKKQVRNLTIIEAALTTGVLGFAVKLYMTYKGVPLTSLKQLLVASSPFLALVIIDELFGHLTSVTEGKQSELYGKFNNRKEDYLKAYYKNQNNQPLDKNEKSVLFGFPEACHVRADRNVIWFASYEVALAEGKKIGITPVTKDPHQTISEDMFVFSQDKAKLDEKIYKNLETIKQQLNSGYPYAEFQMIIPLSFTHENKELKMCFTNVEQVCEFEKKITAEKAKTQKMIATKRWQRRREKEKAKLMQEKTQKHENNM
jgi:hypothetical protein